MSYYSKSECYADVLMALSTGIIEETELHLLRKHYEETEQYECCQGLVAAYIDYKKQLEDVTEDKGISTD